VTRPDGEGPVIISTSEVNERVSVARAIAAIRGALLRGLDPAHDIRRSAVDVAHGQLLLMPSESAEFVGVKLVSVAPGNPAQGADRIQGVYVLMDAATLAPVALIDGVAITTLRTPAVSAAMADYLAPESIDHLVVFGSGPQAASHIEAMLEVRHITRVTIVGRDHDRAERLVSRVRESGLDAHAGTFEDVHDAQLIVCATTARSPLFPGASPPADSLIVAIGSHEADARELDSALIARAQLVVEEVEHAMNESGDVVIPLREGAIAASSIVSMRDIVTGTASVDRGRPRIFKSSGMSWEDLVVAIEVFRAG
jgi:ornithine cyclodeaminase